MMRRAVHAAPALVAARCCQLRKQSDGGPVSGDDAARPDPAVTPEEDATQIEDGFTSLRQQVVNPEHIPRHVEARAPDTRFADYIAEEASSVLYRDAMSAFDPFGGMAHEDYYRDPADGYAPRYAPRDFVHGGDVDSAHHLSTTPATLARQRRDILAHELEQYSSGAERTRAALRQAPSADSRSFVATTAKEQLSTLTHTNRKPADTAWGAAFEERSVFRASHNAVPGPLDQTEAMQQDSTSEVFIARYTMSVTDEAAARERDVDMHNDTSVTNLFNDVHGLYERDAFEEEKLMRRQRTSFDGYDPIGAPASRIDILRQVPIAATEESQAAVRSNTADLSARVIAGALAVNTTAAQPAVGPALADALASRIADTQRGEAAQRQQEFKEKHGFGRRGLLVTESGPDQRSLSLHKNDERLYRAAVFTAMEYADHDGSAAATYDRTSKTTDLSARNELDSGVGRLIETKFDLDRRAALLAQHRRDPLELAHVHYGIPIKQAVDARVRYAQGRPGERHFEFFAQSPSQSDMQLYETRSDTLGFPLFKGRNEERFEFALFERYRAHHQQRRRIALLHGLEPKADETIPERNARRLALDRLCEQTPFEQSRMTAPTGEHKQRPSLETLRQWFGAYWLPSPTLASQMLGSDLNTGLHVTGVDRPDVPPEFNPLDRREHLLSGRYINFLLTVDMFNQRLLRGYLRETLGRCPEVEVQFRQKHNVLKHFTAEQRRAYDEYVAVLSEKHLQLWQSIVAQRRFVASRNEFGAVTKLEPSRELVRVREVASGALLVVTKAAFDDAFGRSNTANGAITIDGVEVVPLDKRLKASAVAHIFTENLVRVKMETTTDVVVMTEAEWLTYPEESPAPSPQQHIHGNGSDRSPFNRLNYIEAQDFVWEQRTHRAEEGWSPALHADILGPGMPVLAPRRLAGGRLGDLERAEVFQYHKQPFFNPDPRTINVRFMRDDEVQEVPLDALQIWQLSRDGPCRTAPQETRQFVQQSRYVDLADPSNKRELVRSSVHFLDKYAPDNRATAAKEKLMRLVDVRQRDTFNEIDSARGENHRLISASHRKDYVRQSYFHRYTPWEYIVHQESEAPVIASHLRSDNVGPAYFHAPNRYWLNKRRPFGEIKNFYNEVRDLLQYVDGITPWDKAKKIRSHWEVREHHPVPYINRPNVALHRNTPALLPNHLWEADKRTGEVKSLKDTVKGYRPTVEPPAWAQ